MRRHAVSKSMPHNLTRNTEIMSMFCVQVLGTSKHKNPKITKKSSSNEPMFVNQYLHMLNPKNSSTANATRLRPTRASRDRPTRARELRSTAVKDATWKC